jgi:hypothetical protein
MCLSHVSGLAAGSNGAHLISKQLWKKQQKTTWKEFLVITGCLDI